jgi:hypothetical protein
MRYYPVGSRGLYLQRQSYHNEKHCPTAIDYLTLRVKETAPVGQFV